MAISIQDNPKYQEAYYSTLGLIEAGITVPMLDEFIEYYENEEEYEYCAGVLAAVKQHINNLEVVYEKV